MLGVPICRESASEVCDSTRCNASSTVKPWSDDVSDRREASNDVPIMNALKSASLRVRALMDGLRTQSTTRAGFPAEDDDPMHVNHMRRVEITARNGA